MGKFSSREEYLKWKAKKLGRDFIYNSGSKKVSDTDPHKKTQRIFHDDDSNLLVESVEEKPKRNISTENRSDNSEEKESPQNRVLYYALWIGLVLIVVTYFMVTIFLK